jgi:hypothetical protein
MLCLRGMALREYDGLDNSRDCVFQINGDGIIATNVCLAPIAHLELARDHVRGIERR